MLEKEAVKAVKQIDKKGYIAELKQQGLKKIMKIGIAFSAKRFALKYEILE